MMELDELKNAWRKLGEIQNENALSAEEIVRLVQARAVSTAGRFGRFMLVELLVSVVVLVLFWWVFKTYRFPDISVEMMQGIYAFLIVLGAVFYALQYRSVKRVQNAALDLRTSLREAATTTRRVISSYRVLMILSPTIGVLLSFWSTNRLDIFFHPLFLLVLAAFTLLYYFPCNWYLKRTYGKHYEELMACLNELEE